MTTKSTAASPAISFNGVGVNFNGSVALEDITIEIPERDFVAIIGPNGAGKSTLLRTVVGLQKPTTGSVSVFGRPPEKARADLGLVPQSIDYDRLFPINVGEVVLTGRLGRKFFGGYDDADRAAAQAAMDRVEITGLAGRKFGELSGGERQRTLIARALAAEPKILLLDEPSSNIDLKTEMNLFALLKELNEQLTIVLVTHDLGVVSTYVKTPICLNRRLVCHGFETITPEMMSRTYGHRVDLISHGVHQRFVFDNPGDKPDSDSE